MFKTNRNRTRKHLLLFIILFLSFWTNEIFGQKFVDTLTIPSQSMKQEFKALVFLPENYYTSKKAFPVLYLLHGYTGYYNNWYKREPKLIDYATQYQMIIVTPEGTYDSWYLDSPIHKKLKFETYIGKEVPNWIDLHYKTINDKQHRAICGLSMGGHGAMTIAADYSKTFGAASSISGVLDVRPFADKYRLMNKLGKFCEYPSRWYQASFVGKIDKIQKNGLTLMIDCGLDDPFYEVNELVHQKLIKNGLEHDYVIRPGKHNWKYWKNALPYHLLFFKKYFDRHKLIK